MTGRRRFWLVNGTLAVVVAVLALLGANTIFHKTRPTPPPRTVTAALGTVQLDRLRQRERLARRRPRT